MRRRLSQDVWVIIGLFVLVVVIGVVTSGRQRGSGGPEFTPRRTTYLSSPSGLKALYVTLDKLGYRMKRHLSPLTTEPDDGVLFIVSPENVIADAEWQSLRKWVERGNLLVLASGNDTFVTTDALETKRSTAKYPSFLCPGVASFRASDVERIREDEWGFGHDDIIPQPGGG